MAKKTVRPGRTLLIFALSAVVLYGLVALGGDWKPKLGLDLEGGTRITLTALGKQPTNAKLKQAADIIDSRVNGSGVSESAVSTQGGKNIIVEIPGKERRDLVNAVERTALLRFRVTAAPGAQPGTATPSGSPTGQPSGSPTTTPSGAATKTPATGQSPTATPKPRTAPMIDRPQATTTPTPTGQPTSQPTSQPTTQPTTPETPGGASINDPLAWAQNPGTAWQQKFAAYVCPSKKDDKPIADDPDQPLITCDEDGNKYLLSKSVIEGTELKSASSGTDPNGIGFIVNLSLKGDAPKVFGDVTASIAQTGGTFAVVLDGKVISAATAQAPIRNGSATISGSFTESEARSLANSLKFGALPIRFDNPPTVETVGPSLAGNQLSAGVFAGIVGLLIVMAYCLLYYRGLGTVVIASLMIAAAVTYAVVLALAKTAGFTLTLPGIAGLIVAVGITADSFIVYFERIRDEMRGGKSMRVAVEAGWVRARNTCLAADAVSLLASIVLYIFAIGVVRGFAFALGVSTLIDIAVFFWFTKPVMTLLARRTFFNSGHRLSGLSPETLGIDGERTATTRLVEGRA